MRASTDLEVSTLKLGNPLGVPNAGSSNVASSSAFCMRIGSPESAYAASSPPRYRITVSKNGAYVPPLLNRT